MEASVTGKPYLFGWARGGRTSAIAVKYEIETSAEDHAEVLGSALDVSIREVGVEEATLPKVLQVADDR